MATQSGKKILIVDDDKFLLDMYAVKFKEGGYEVNLSSSGPEALKKLHEGLIPDVILLDMVMPEMSGLELLEKLRGEEKLQSVIIVLSNLGQAADMEKAKKLGVDAYILKASAIPSEVLDIVSSKLQSKHE